MDLFVDIMMTPLLFVFVVAGARLRNLSKRFAKMPTEDFLMKLLKNKAGAASTAGGSSTVEKGNKSHSNPIVQGSEVVASEPAGEVPPKDKKMHRDGHSTRPHHSEKFKEVANDSGRGEVPLSVKSGVEVRALSSLDVSVSGGTSGGLRLCKAYVDKVYWRF